MKIVEDILKGILLISVIAIGVLFFYQKSVLKDAGVERGEVVEQEVAEEKQKEVVLEEGDMPGWQKYTSQDWGFEIQIPDGWSVEEKLVDEDNINIQYGGVEAGDLSQINIRGNDYAIVINKNNEIVYRAGGEVEKYERNVAGQIVTISEDSDPYFGNEFFFAFALQFSEDYYSFRVGSDESEDRDIIYSIVDTFKEVNWQTYRNEEHGFEIQHPEDWFAHQDGDFNFIKNENVDSPLRLSEKGIWIIVNKHSIDQSFEDTVAGLFGKRTIESKKVFEISGFKTIKQLENNYPDLMGEDKPILMFYIHADNHVYRFIVYVGNEDIYIEEEDFIDSIVNSFKLI